MGLFVLRTVAFVDGQNLFHTAREAIASTHEAKGNLPARVLKLL